MKNYDLLKIAKLTSKLKNQEDIKAFEDAVWKLGNTHDKDILSELVDLFDDKCTYQEVMYSLIHAVEQAPNEIYIPLIISKIPRGLEKYPYWIEILCNRIFNEKSCLDLFRKNMFFIPKEKLFELFEIMERESPHHTELIQELHKELNKQKG